MTNLLNPTAWLGDLLAQLGVEGVSTVALVFLVSVALWAHKGARYGGKAATVGATAVTQAKLTALLLAALLVLGVIHIDPARGQQLLESGIRMAQTQLGGGLPW